MQSTYSHQDLASNLEACIPIPKTLATDHGEILVTKATLRHYNGSGASNTIGILLIAHMWAAYSLEIIVGWVEAGQGLCTLEWTLPGFPLTVFTTRHSVVADEESQAHGVRFDGGLDWAKTAAVHFRLLQPDPATPAHQPQRRCPALALARGLTQSSPPCDRNSYYENTGTSLQRSWSGSSDQLPIQSTIHTFPPTPPQDSSQYTYWPLPHASNDPPHTYTQYPLLAEEEDSEDGDGTLQPGSPETLTYSLTSASTSRLPTPSQGDVPSHCAEEWTDQDVQNQVYIEFLRQRRLEAQDLYMRTGDPSGLLDLCSAAITAGEGVWRPSGLPYF
ncbi:hypothetical protein QBC39DRAFT_352386 [Podospora conica]|nr:hypothetical protein QBC39DRAFT_352386 [Schizothecium conicum]